MLTVYGLKNCDTCRKARKWLAEKGIAHEFVDLRAQPVSNDDVRKWAASVGTDVLLNKRGTTWRNLPEPEKSCTSDDDLIDLMHRHPALIKRPVFVMDDTCLVGFSAGTQDILTGRG